MKIGIDATGVWGIKEGLLSGIVLYTVALATRLTRLDSGHEWYVYCRDDVPDVFSVCPDDVRFRTYRSRNRKWLQQTRLPLAARRDGLDVLFYPLHSASLINPCPSVITIHDLHPFVVPERFDRVHGRHIHRTGLRSSLNKSYWRQMLRIASRRADRIIAVSHSTKRDIEQVFGVGSDKIDVVYEGVDRERFNTDRDGRDLGAFREQYGLPERYALCVGTHAYKNIEGIVAAFGMLGENSPVHLVLAGNKAYLGPEVFRMIDELALRDRVVLTGFFPDEDLKHLYQAAEMFVFPSFYEGFGLPVLEAFACGTPVITSTAGSLPEVAGDAALQVDPDDVRALADAIERLARDEAFRADRREAGFRQAARFSWDSAAQGTLEVLERAGARRRQ